MRDESSEQECIAVTGAVGEYVEKRSRFIATLIPVSSEETAVEKIGRLRKKYYDARHNCYAYIVFSPDGREVIERSSDDGEPSGTAGRPILEVLAGGLVRNVLVVVTRYFGGTLLGTGGLVRAYQAATKEALIKSGLAPVADGRKMVINLDYTALGPLQNRMRELAIEEYESEYGDNVSLTVIVPSKSADIFNKDLTEIFAGKERVEDLGAVRYGRGEGGIFLL